MQNEAQKHVWKCERCIRFKAKPERTSLEAIKATYLMELIHLDYLTLETNEGGKGVNVLVLTKMSH